MVLLIDNYDSFTYNIYQLVEQLGFRCKVVRNDALSLQQIKKLKPRRIILSPGPGTPDESGVCLDVLREEDPKLNILGVCLGHQAIGQCFGAKVVRAKTLLHGKISEVYHPGKGIFRGLPSPFPATRYHSLVVTNVSSPLEVTAKTKDGIIMGLRHKKLPIEGVQFHPESIMTPDGSKLVENFLK